MILLIDKPVGISSFDVIRILRRQGLQVREHAGRSGAGRFGADAQTKKPRVKMGHAGTLDPLASGLMIIATEADTKCIEKFMGMPKEYECTVEFGRRSSSGDADGEITEGSCPASPNKNFHPGSECCTILRGEFEKKLERFVGTIEQRPPQTSAIKIEGKRAYKLAREGKIVEMPVRQVQIFSIEILKFMWPRAKLRVKCAKGTYIRSLAIDLGEAVGGGSVEHARAVAASAAVADMSGANSGCGAYLTSLRRTAIGEYRVEDAEQLPPDEVEHLRARFGRKR